MKPIVVASSDGAVVVGIRSTVGPAPGARLNVLRRELVDRAIAVDLQVDRRRFRPLGVVLWPRLSGPSPFSAENQCDGGEDH
jgi:hypothetical protein